MTPTQASAGRGRADARTRARRIDWLVAIALFALTTIVVGMTADDVGFTRDEGYYFKAGEQYWGWFAALGDALADGDLSGPFSQAVIDKHLKYNHEHPVLMKNLFALSFGLLHKKAELFAQSSDAFRFPAWLFAGLSVALTFALARTLLRRRSAVLAALLWFCMPRTFWHMHLACFDVPVFAAHTWLVLAYLRGRWSVGGAVLCGLAFGLAACVKHNVLPVPALFVLHWLIVEARRPRTGARGLTLPPIPLAFFAMAILGPLVFVAHWPYLWPDVLLRTGQYLGFHLNHEHYPILWFGELLTKPPFPVSFPFVMTAITVPVPVLALFAAGGGLSVVVIGRFLFARFMLRDASPAETTQVPLGDPQREHSASPALLLLINGLYPFVLIALPSSPIFGGTKHWMNALPFLIVLGVWALEEGIARLSRVVSASAAVRAAVFVVLAALVVVPGAWLTARVHPYGLSSYNALIGFARGAANVGFQRTFWGYEPREALPMINDHEGTSRRIHFGDTNYDGWRFYRRDGLLDDDVRWSGSVQGSNIASVQPQGEFKDQWIQVLNHWGVAGPDHVVHVEGVPLATITFKP